MKKRFFFCETLNKTLSTMTCIRLQNGVRFDAPISRRCVGRPQGIAIVNGFLNAHPQTPDWMRTDREAK